MKQEVVAKINKFGKVGEVIANICRICVIMGVAILLAAGILVLAVMPKGMMNINMKTVMGLTFDAATIGETFATEDVSEMEASLREEFNGNVSANGEELMLSEVVVNGDVMEITAETDKVELLSKGKVVVFLIMQLLQMAVAIVTITFIIKLCKEFKTCETPFSSDVIKRMKQVGYSLIPWCITFPTAEAAANFMVSNNLNISIDLGMIIMVLVVITLTHIFKYGAMLQQESDETL